MVRCSARLGSTASCSSWRRDNCLSGRSVSTGTALRYGIDYSVDPAFRGRGWAKQLVALGLQHFRDPQEPSFAPI